MDMAGMAWFIEEKESTIKCIQIMSPPRRFAQGILGTVEAKKRSDIKRSPQFRDHFAYDEYDTVGEQYAEDKYAAITKFDRILYSTVWKVVGRFDEADFERLEQDPTVSKLYSNGELDVYLIHSSGSLTEQ